MHDELMFTARSCAVPGLLEHAHCRVHAGCDYRHYDLQSSRMNVFVKHLTFEAFCGSFALPRFLIVCFFLSFSGLAVFLSLKS